MQGANCGDGDAKAALVILDNARARGKGRAVCRP
jgi:hypothetical protein